MDVCHSSWRITRIIIALLILVCVLAYWQTASYLLSIWNQLEIGEYAHGYLVVAISIFLLIRSRKVYAGMQPSPAAWALPGVFIASLLWLLASIAGVEVVQAAALLLLVLGVLWAVLGHRLAWALSFPVLFIAFAIPIWFPLSPLLQDLTADTVYSIIRMLGVPAYFQNNLIVLSSGTLSIEEACSGLRYLLAALTLGTLYGYMNYRTLNARLLVVAIAAMAAIIVNIVRVFIVVYLAYKTDMQHPFVSDHLMLGWYLFGALVVLLLFIDARLYKRYQPAQQTIPPQSPAAISVSKQASVARIVGISFVTLVLLVSGPIAEHLIAQNIASQGAHALQMPAAPPGWTGPLATDDTWQPVYNGAQSAKMAYQHAHGKLTLFLAYYPHQQQGAEIINDRNSVSNTKLWKPRVTRDQQQLSGVRTVLDRVIESQSGEQRVLWYWYYVAGRYTVNKYEAKILQVIGVLLNRPQALVVIAVADSSLHEEQARALLNEFATGVDAALVRVASQRPELE